MALTGSGLYSEIKPILDQGSTSFAEFRLNIGAKIAFYVSTNALIDGIYSGTIPHGGVSPLVVATGKLVILATPPKLDEPIPYDFIKWIKNTLLNTITWNIIANIPHTSTPIKITPTVSLIDVLGDFSDLRTSYGFWAMVCDAIICSIRGHVPISITATGTDGSSGTITWTPTEIPEVKHNFMFRVMYDENNLPLVQWIRNYIIDLGDLSGEIDIPFNDYTYQSILVLWKNLVSLTKDCEFYKKQDNNELILLRTGSQI